MTTGLFRLLSISKILIIIIMLIFGLVFPPSLVALAQDEVPPAPATDTTSGAAASTDGAAASSDGAAASSDGAAASSDGVAASSDSAATVDEAAPADSAGAVVDPIAGTTVDPSSILVNGADSTDDGSSSSDGVDANTEMEQVAEIFQAAAEEGVTLADSEGEALSAGTVEVSELLNSDSVDPFFCNGIDWVGFTLSGTGCPAGVICNQSDTPLQAAISAAPENATIFVGAQTYNENVTINKSLSLVGIETGTGEIVSNTFSGWTFANAYASSFTLNAGANILNSTDATYNVFAPIVNVYTGAKIQQGIDLVSAGGIVNVSPGVYNEVAADRQVLGTGAKYQFGLFISQKKDGITVQGVDATGTPIHNFNNVVANITTNATNNFGTDGVFVEGDNVTLSGLNFGDNAAGNNKTIEVIGDNFTFMDNKITVSDGGSLYFNDWQFNSTDNTSHIQKYNVIGNSFINGASLDLTSGTGLSGDVSGRIIQNNVFDGTGASWALISFSGSHTGVPWFVQSVGGAVIENNTFTNGGEWYIRARGDYDNSQFNWKDYYNKNTFDKKVVTLKDLASFDLQEYTYPAADPSYNMFNTRSIGATIQGGVDHALAGAGNTVLVGPGVYVEQVEIAKNVTLQGSQDVNGNLLTTIQSPNVLSKSFTPPTYSKKAPILYVHNANSVTIQDVIVDGASKGNANAGFLGIGYYNAGGTINNVDVKNIINNPFSGAQNGVGIGAYNTDDVLRNLTIKDSSVTNFQKNGMALSGKGLTVNVDGNTVTGAGPTTVIAQNGIQLSYGATGTIQNNTVSNVSYTPSGWASTAILLYDAGNNVEVKGNTVTGSDYGIHNYLTIPNPTGYQWTAENNTISGNNYGVENWSAGNLLLKNNTFTNNHVGVEVYQGSTMQSSGNTFTGDPSASGNIGVNIWDAGTGSTLTGDSISGFDIGVDTNDSSLVIRGSRFFNNDLAIWNEAAASTATQTAGAVTGALDANGNWWGSNDPSFTDKTRGSVNTDSWLNFDLFADPQTISVGGTSQLTPALYSSADPLKTPISGLPWFENSKPTVGLSGTVLGTLANNVFTGSLAGVQTLTSTLDAEVANTDVTINALPFVPPTNDSGGKNPSGEAGVGGGAPGVIPVTGTIPVTGAGLMDLVCGGESNFSLSNGDGVGISGPCGGQANMAVETEESLPGPLPAGVTFVDAISVSIVVDGDALDTFPADQTLSVSFAQDQLEGNFAILHWDGEKWVEVSSDELSTSGSLMGVFVLVTR